MVLSNLGIKEALTYGEVSVGEVGNNPAPPPAALLAGEVDMAARARAGSLPAPLPMRRYGLISCCVMPLEVQIRNAKQECYLFCHA